ncbi:MAG: UvrB/UvrC motif-containing protein [Oscillospiraceae bacterium]|nr:UvrB/UvrC motif-containing protein [Oscillospiraceae bacterium]
MICENCKQNIATTHYKQIINGKAGSYYLCGECAENMGISSIAEGLGFGMGDFFAKMFDTSAPPIAKIQKQCGKCKYTLDHIKDQGRMGCDECYSCFEYELKPYIKKMHGSVKHTGKIPKTASEEIRKSRKISELQEKLDHCVSQQDFETAAKLRDEIKELQSDE